MAYRQGTLATCERAKNYLQETDKDGFDCVVMAHTHKVGDTKKGFIRLFEQGSCSHVEEMEYMDGRLTDPQKKALALAVTSQ